MKQLNPFKGGASAQGRKTPQASHPSFEQDRIDRAILRHSRWAYKARRYQLMDGAR